MEILKLGSSGENVKKILTFLNITADGSFGPKTEAAVKTWQTNNNLTPDGIVGEKTWNKMFGLSKCVDSSVKYSPITTHVTCSPNRPIKYLAIHYTAGGSSKKGSAEGVKNVFLNRKASADFAVDDETILQINPDLKNYYCWAVGDKKNNYSLGGSLYGKATNKNTISIEICSNLKKGTSAAVSNHEGWYFTDAALNNAIKLSKILMKKYNIDIDHVVRHYDISGKLCPGIVGWNNGKIYTTEGKNTQVSNNSESWNKFKSRLMED